MLQSAVLARRRLSRDPSAGDRRHHHRRLDPERARARTGRSGDRQLERLRRRPAELAAADATCSRCFRPRADPMALPPPSRSLAVEAASVVPPGGDKAVVQDVSFTLQAGNGLGIIGPSGSGKSRWRACWSGSGARRAAAFVSMAPRSINGRRRRSASTSAICRRMSSCSPARWRRTSPAFEPTRSRRWSSRPPQRPACTISSSSLPDGYETAGRRAAAPRCRPDRRSASRSPARSTAIRSWWCSTSRIPISTPRATRRSAAPSWACAAAAASSSSSRTGRAPSPASIMLLVMNQGRPQAFGPKDEVLAKVLQRTPRRAARRSRSCRKQEPPSHESAGHNRTPSGRSAATCSPALVIVIVLAGGVGGWAGTTDALRRADRAGLARRRFQRQEGSAPDRRHRRRAARARRRPRQGRRHRGAARRHRDPRQPRHRHQGARRAYGPQGAARERARRRRRDQIPGRSSSSRQAIPTSPRSSTASASCSICAATRAPARRRSCASGSSQLKEEIGGLTAQQNSQGQGNRADRARTGRRRDLWKQEPRAAHQADRARARSHAGSTAKRGQLIAAGRAGQGQDLRDRAADHPDRPDLTQRGRQGDCARSTARSASSSSARSPPRTSSSASTSARRRTASCFSPPSTPSAASSPPATRSC